MFIRDDMMADAGGAVIAIGFLCYLRIGSWCGRDVPVSQTLFNCRLGLLVLTLVE